MTEQRFSTTVISGHKGTLAVDVPFEPAVVWPGLASVAMTRADDPRGGRGWPVTGTMNGRPFAGFVGRRYGRSYIVLDDELRAAGLADGTDVDVTVRPAAG